MLLEYISDGKTHNYERQWEEKYPAYCWMRIMRVFSNSGHFPISVDKNGNCFYDLLTIETEVKAMDDQVLMDFMQLSKEVFEYNQVNIQKIEHYDMLRNYMLCIAEQLKSYYDELGEYLESMTGHMSKLILMHPELVVDKGDFKDYVVYTLENDENMHAFRKDDDVMMDFVKFSKEAEKHLQDCLIIRASVQ